jgi:polyhydroxybutyrate depolymerase
MKSIVTFALFLALILACRLSAQPQAGGTPPPLTPGNSTRTLTHSGRERSYIVHVPPAYDSSRPSPVVLVFHGGGGNAENIDKTTHFNKQADEAGFLVVYPNGTGKLKDTLLTWNGGTCCGYAVENNVDDVGFVRLLLSDLRTVASVDEKRIYATGLSNGGIMSYRLACDAADIFAAVAPVAGTQNYAACSPSGPVSVLHIHGTGDEHLPYDGGAGAKSLAGVDFESVAGSIAFWTSFDRCPAKPVSTQNGSVVHDVYAPCAQDSTVELYTVLGGLHAWPGGEPGWLGGDEPTREFDATQVIWDFFAAHPKP